MSTIREQLDPADTTEGWKPDPMGSDDVRYWDGVAWTDRIGEQQTISTPASLSQKPPEERKAQLAQRIQYMVNVEQARVESQTDYQAVVVTGKKVNHLLHLLLTLITFGLWAIVWIVLALAGGEKRRVVTVDEYGQVLG